MTQKKIAVLGGGELCDAWCKKNQNQHAIEVFTHTAFDLSSQDDCDGLLARLLNQDVVIITAGVYKTDLWQSWLVNCVGPCYIASRLAENKFVGKILLISSHAANWTSWPGIDIQRLTYNNAKHAGSNFLLGLAQGSFAGKFCVIEPSKFQSHMSDHQGQPIANVVDAIDYAIDKDAFCVVL